MTRDGAAGGMDSRIEGIGIYRPVTEAICDVGQGIALTDLRKQGGGQ